MACLEQMVELLTRVRNASSGRIEHDPRAMLSSIRDIEIEELFERGMHEYLSDFLANINHLAVDISEHFLLPLQPISAQESA